MNHQECIPNLDALRGPRSLVYSSFKNSRLPQSIEVEIKSYITTA